MHFIKSTLYIFQICFSRSSFTLNYLWIKRGVSSCLVPLASLINGFDFTFFSSKEFSSLALYAKVCLKLQTV